MSHPAAATRDAFLPNTPGHGELGDDQNPWWALHARNIRLDGEDLATRLTEQSERLDEIEETAVVAGLPFQW